MGSEECFKLWMEAEANYGAELDSRIADEKREDGRLFFGGRSAREEDWSSAAHDASPETYEERQSGRSSKNVEHKDSGEVGSTVFLRPDEAPVKQLETRSLRNNDISTSNRNNYELRQGGSPFSVLDRIIVPHSCQAGIPRVMDAGERLPMPAPLGFDAEDDLPEDVGAKHGRNFLVNSLASQLGKRTRSGDSWNRKEGEPSSGTNECKSGPISKKKRRKARRVSCDGNEVVHALRGFAKVLAQVEEAKVVLMKDLEKRRRDLQMKIANCDPYAELLEETSSPAAPLILL